MITPSFSLTATERVLPSMALDFTTASLDSRVTFTRSGNTATVTNSSGVIAAINANLPRFDFDPIALTCKGLLIEEARTNFTLGSVAFNNVTYWTPSSATIGATPITAPDNTSTGFKLVESATTAVHLISAVLSWATTIGQIITRSVYVKAGERFRFEIQADSAAYGAVQRAGFNLQTVTASITTGTGTARIVNVGNGWYRCSFTAPAATAISASTGGQFRILDDAGNPSYAGNGTSGLYLWGAQREDGAFATSFIPTVASTVLRNVDVATMTSTNFSSWYTATIGAAVVWAIPQAVTGVRPLLQFDDTTALEIITLRGNVADPELYIVDGGVAQAQIDAGTIVANTAYKLSGGWDTNNCAAAKDGGTVGTDVVATIPTPTQLRIGSDGTNYASAIIQKVLYYPQRIINAEVQAISK